MIIAHEKAIYKRHTPYKKEWYDMEYMKRGRDIILKQEDLDLAETLDCGQAFRWSPVADGFCGYFLNKPLTILAERDHFILKDTTEDEFLNVWADYFDLYTDYGEMKRIFSEDKTLSAACAFAGGIRLLKQDFFECLISFIISQNNNIPRIKGIIGRLCDMFGGFPDAGRLAAKTSDGLSPLRAGFRAKYIEDAAQKISSGIISEDMFAGLSDAEAEKLLRTVRGIGPKVAQCVMLYGMHRISAFPEDVWIKRVMAEYYPDGLPDYVMPYRGIAQQYLFHYIRNNRV